MRLLFITQKLHGQDAFTVLWIRAFMARGYVVTVLCLEKTDAVYPFDVYSLGKERGTSRLLQIFTFLRLISTLSYDRAFIHMTPVWGIFGMPVWLARRTPVYCWYTHYRMQLGVRLLHVYGKRFFCATAQSLPQYAHSPKKIVVGHGIDVQFWHKRDNACVDPQHLLVVHRISRSKRLEIVLRAMTFLPRSYRVDIYGIVSEPDYLREMKELTTALHLNARVFFHDTVPMDQLPRLYSSHRFIVNMASDTIDKTMLEAMTCGCFPVITRDNARAIGFDAAPSDDSPASLARALETCVASPPLSAEAMFDIVARRHSLERLAAVMDEYIAKGI